jgi:hypothetical protein
MILRRAGCIPNGFAGRVHERPGHLCGRPCGDGVSLFDLSLFFRTVSHSAVRTSNSPNPTEPKGFACEKACVWPAVPLAIPALPPILRLARAGFFARGNNHDHPAKLSIRCLRGNSGAAHPLVSRLGHSHSPASASLVSCATRGAFHRGRFSGRTLPRPLCKMARS